MIQPLHWKFFIESEGLLGKHTVIPEEEDLSRLGADICWFDDEDSRLEKEDLYPGMAVSHDEFIPVGGCNTGSGDPYFICEKDGADGPLYRIYHDAVREDGYCREDAVAIVLQNYQSITKFKK
jgi:hypothetical protein